MPSTGRLYNKGNIEVLHSLLASLCAVEKFFCFLFFYCFIVPEKRFILIEINEVNAGLIKQQIYIQKATKGKAWGAKQGQKPGTAGIQWHSVGTVPSFIAFF